MNKKIVFCFFSVLILFVVSGCDLIEKKVVEQQMEDEYTEKFECPILNQIKMSVSPIEGEKMILLTQDGKLYKLGNYSDGTHCKLISDTIFGTRVIYDVNNSFEGSFLIDDSDHIYMLRDNQLEEFQYSSMYEDIIKNKSIMKVTFDWSALFDYYKVYYLKEDGILYTAKVTKTNYKLIDEEIALSFENEKILDFQTTEYRYLSWIKTDKAYYVNKVKDERCRQYDDVECEYHFAKDDYLTNIYNDIAFVYECTNGKHICNYILKNGMKYQDHIGG